MPAESEAARRLACEVYGEEVHPQPCPEYCHQERLTRVLIAERQAGEREGLEKALAEIKSMADSLYEWMKKLDVGTPERKELSLRAGELFQTHAAIRALLEPAHDEER